ncbi:MULTISPECIES: Uma2 family endonuclease [unclassified Microcoleus]|uniref:Uma2 family endonuclease n=1 Tax=unclassified Microcoleus TaxID=2642155 RepID=UPI002FD43664
MQLELKQITVQPGNQLQLKDITWQMYETILAELGENRSSRLSYSNGTLEIMVPCMEHEIGKVLIGNLVEALLEELNIDFWSLGSTTLKNANMAQGLEADNCFYIQNEAAVRGKNRIDLATDPPPDLAIEIDITSRTQLNNYEALGVPELWRYNGRSLQISVLQDGKYIQSDRSLQFPNFPIAHLIPQYIEQSKTAGRNVTMKAFRSWVRSQI